MGLRSDPEKHREWQRRSAAKAAENAKGKPRRKMKSKGARQSRIQPEMDAAYEAMRRRSRGRCEARVRGVCVGVASDGHHRGKRSVWPELRASVENLMHVCRPCHDWIDANQQEASEMDPPLHLWRTRENEILMGVVDGDL